MTRSEFQLKFEDELPIYKQWGTLVLDSILQVIKHNDANSPTPVLRVETEPRIKSLESILAKAYDRNKHYSDPYNEITDKVGVRFVVLLRKEVAVIGSIIQSMQIWAWSKDRDYEREAAENPTTFGYQADHYVVRASSQITYNDVIIPAQTPCEIQVRTLLQHAYSEATHDSIYKPNLSSTTEMKRNMAKCSAFIETTDQIFETVMQKLTEMQNDTSGRFRQLSDLYRDVVSAEPAFEYQSGDYMADALGIRPDDIDVSRIRDVLNDYPSLGSAIKKRALTDPIYRQPLILYIYFMARQHRSQLTDQWPYTERELLPIFNDLSMVLH